MVKKRYYFPYVEKGTPFYHYALTSKSLLERLGEVDAAFKRFADNSNSESPKHILYLMLQHNESLLNLSQYASAPEPDSTLPAVESRLVSPTEERKPGRPSLKRRRLSLSDPTQSGGEGTESSSSHQVVFDKPRRKRSSTISKATDLVPIPEESNPSISDLNREHSSVEEPAKSGSLETESSSPLQTVSDIPPKKDDSTFSKPPDLVPVSQVQPQESTSTETSSHSTTVKELSSPIKEPQKDNKDVDPSSKAEMDTKIDSESRLTEFKVPAHPVKDKKGTFTVSKPTDLVPASQVQPQESTSTETSSHSTTVRELSGLIKEFKKDIYPTICLQEVVDPSDKAEMDTKRDSRSPEKECKIPALPVKDKKGISTVSKPTDLVPSSQDSKSTETSSHSTTVKELSSPIKEPKKDIKEDVDPSNKAEMDTKTDFRSPPIEFKVPALPVKDKEGTSTVSKPTDLVPASQVEPRKSTSTETSNITTAVKKMSIPIKEKDISPNTFVQENVNPSDKSEMSKKTGSRSPGKEFKIPELPVTDKKEVSKPAKRPAELSSIPSPEFVCPSKKSKTEDEMDISLKSAPTCVQEDINPSDKAEMSKKTDSKSPEKKFKIPELPVKDTKEVSKPAKRPAESSLIPSPEFICPSKKSKTEDEMDISSNKSPSAKRPTNLSLSPRPEFVSPTKNDKSLLRSIEDDEMDISPNKGDEISDILSKMCTDIAVSQDKVESATQTLPNKDAIEIDMVSGSEEKPGPSYQLTSAEMENLIDDPLRVQSIKEAVEERIKVSISLKETKGDFSPSEKKGSNRSPRKSRRIGSPGKDIKTTSQPDPEKVSPSILTHPNVMAYLKLKFKSILSNRDNYMQQIYDYFLTFYSDVNFLFYYSYCIFIMARDIPVEGEVYFTREVRTLKGKLMWDAREIRSHLQPFAEEAKVDVPFWARSVNEIRRLNAQNEHLLSAESSTHTTLELLREYESKLRVIWNRMDQKVLATDGTRLTILEISDDFKKLIKDFARYLVMIELMKPNSLASSVGSGRRMNVSWH